MNEVLDMLDLVCQLETQISIFLLYQVILKSHLRNLKRHNTTGRKINRRRNQVGGKIIFTPETSSVITTIPTELEATPESSYSTLYSLIIALT